MKKNLLLSIVAAIAVAMTSCSEKAQNTEEPLAGTDYTLVTTPQGAKGIKKGETFIVEPKADYKSISPEGGMFVAKTESGYALLDPETGYEKISGDTIVWKTFFFECKRGENFIVYIPAYKCQFAAQAYAVSGAYAIAIFNGKITIWGDGEQLVDPNNEYKKIAVLPNGTFLLLENENWGTGEPTKDKLIMPGKSVSPKELKKFQAMKGWNDSSPVMILE